MAILRGVLVAIGALMIVFAIFLHRDAERNLRNRLVDWWIQVTSAGERQIDKQMAFTREVAKRSLRLLDFMFGEDLVSFRMAWASVMLSLFGLTVFIACWAARVKRFMPPVDAPVVMYILSFGSHASKANTVQQCEKDFVVMYDEWSPTYYINGKVPGVPSSLAMWAIIFLALAFVPAVRTRVSPKWQYWGSAVFLAFMSGLQVSEYRLPFRLPILATIAVSLLCDIGVVALLRRIICKATSGKSSIWLMCLVVLVPTVTFLLPLEVMHRVPGLLQDSIGLLLPANTIDILVSVVLIMAAVLFVTVVGVWKFLSTILQRLDEDFPTRTFLLGLGMTLIALANFGSTKDMAKFILRVK